MFYPYPSAVDSLHGCMSLDFGPVVLMHPPRHARWLIAATYPSLSCVPRCAMLRSTRPLHVSILSLPFHHGRPRNVRTSVACTAALLHTQLNSILTRRSVILPRFMGVRLAGMKSVPGARPPRLFSTAPRAGAHPCTIRAIVDSPPTDPIANRLPTVPALSSS